MFFIYLDTLKFVDPCNSIEKEEIKENIKETIEENIETKEIIYSKKNIVSSYNYGRRTNQSNKHGGTKYNTRNPKNKSRHK